MKKKNILILGALLILILLISLGCGKNEQKKGNVETSDKNEQSEGSEDIVEIDKIEFPYESEDGKIKIDSLFQFTGFNPDCQNEEGENIAGIQLTNISSQHLTKAAIVMHLEDGALLEFDVWDVPAGRNVLAFSKQNISIENSQNCKKIVCETSLEDETPLKLKYVVDGTEITVTNMSGVDLTGVKVYCHNVLEETYFGGTTYCYEINLLKNGQSTVVDAFDCIMGETDVVRIEHDLK